MLEDKLLQIGLNKTEAKVYLELLKIGPQPVSVVAKRVDLNRTTAYSVLRSLQLKGVAGSYVNSKTKIFIANDPNSLVALVDRKCRAFDYYRNDILSLIPRFRELMSGLDLKKPVVSYFEGIEGVKNVMYDALNAQGIFYACIAFEKWFDSGLKDFLVEYKNMRTGSKKVPLKAIVPDTETVRAFFKDHYDPNDPMTEFLWVDCEEDWSIFDNEMNIYDDKVAFMHLESGQEYGVVIESKEIAGMQRKVFEMAWRSALLSKKQV